jgi:hypothetical protein
MSTFNPIFYYNTMSVGNSILKQALISAYKLSDASDSLNVNNGSSTGVTYTNSRAVDGNAAQFTLRTNRLHIPYSSSLVFSNGTIDKPFSIKSNIYLTRIIGTVNYIFSRSTTANNNTSEYIFYVRATGELALILLNKNAGGVYIGAQSPPLSILINTPYNVIVTYDGTGVWTGIKLYINGILQTTSALNNGTGYVCMSNTNTSLFTNIGKIGTSSFDSPLTIDETYVFNRVITQSEVTTLQTLYYPNF